MKRAGLCLRHCPVPVYAAVRPQSKLRYGPCLRHNPRVLSTPQCALFLRDSAVSVYLTARSLSTPWCGLSLRCGTVPVYAITRGFCLRHSGAFTSGPDLVPILPSANGLTTFLTIDQQLKIVNLLKIASLTVQVFFIKFKFLKSSNPNLLFV
jgi:hypothetical protein